MQVILYIFLFWFAYQLIFRFIVPIYKATRHLKKGFRAMHEQMNSQQAQQPGQGFQSTPPNNPRPDEKDYIEFEEIK